MPTAPPLQDLRSDERRYRLEHKLAEGRSFDVLVATDVIDPRTVVLRSIRYDLEAPLTAHHARRALLEEEAALLAQGIPALPQLVGRVYTPNPELARIDASLAEEPLLAVEHVEGDRLDRWLQSRHSAGMPAREAVALFTRLLDAVAALHGAGYVVRALAPEHVVITPDGQPRLVGTGNIGRIGAPLPRHKTCVVEAYTAPELIDDQSGRYATARADLYSLGALLSLLLTNVPPSANPEAPIRAEAFDRLRALDEGYGLLIAHLTQPLHAGRFEDIAALRPWLAEGALPTPGAEGFAGISLMEPWTPEGYEVGRLSAGPLVVRTQLGTSPEVAPAAPAPAPPSSVEADPPSVLTPADRRRRWVGLAALIVLVLLVVIGRSLG